GVRQVWEYAEQWVAHVGIVGEPGFKGDAQLRAGVGVVIWRLGFRGFGRCRLILVGPARIGLVVGHGRRGEAVSLGSKRDIDRKVAKIKGQGARAALPCSRPWGSFPRTY